YSEAYQATGRQRYADTARRIIDYVKRDLTAPDGAFYSAEDADSEGEEGKFYVWTKAEVEQLLNKDDAEFAERVFHIEAAGNVHDEATGQLTGANVLYVDEDKSETARSLGLGEAEFDRRFESVRKKLLAARDKRIRPFLDDKILADWNGMMIAALATAARALHEPAYAEDARRAADFILHTMRTRDGGLLHRFRDGQVGIEGQLDDYAFLSWGLIELYETDFNVRDLQAALDLNAHMLEHFGAESGGLYSTSDDAEKLPVRPIDPADGALPSGNAIAMMNMLRLSLLTGDATLEARAAKIAHAFAGEINGMPSAFCAMLSALDFAEGTGFEVVLAGDRDSADGQAMLKAVRSRFLPDKVVLWRPEGKDAGAVVKLAPFTAEQKAIDGKATAYVCRNFQCNLPTTDPKRVLALLEESAK
ncbi:MAG TPA: thioredoxin domain-containing protein, partial [Mariprofundaceae bacterium]|nr:thioredoxin domain-containing protein [Mariprofundaceae bacterium]